MANISITLEGIDQAIANLKYRPGSVKYKAIQAIRSCYTSKESIRTLNNIDTDAVIRSVWDVGDSPLKLKSKRRNFSSVKSSIIKDLEKLSKKDLNPENLTLTESNIFDMTEEAKSNLLSSFSDAVKTGDINLEQATSLLQAVSEFLDDYQADDQNKDPEDILEQIRNILKRISDDVPPDEDEALEEIEIDEDEDIEEIELDEDEEIEEIDEDEDIEEIEIDEDDDLEDLDDLDEDELKALEEFREKRELAEHFDQTLGEREKKYNKYTTIPEGDYTIGSKKSLKSNLELQQFHMPRVYMGIYPVTNAFFEIFIEETGYITTAEKRGFGRVYTSNYKRTSHGSNWNKNPGSEDVKGACWFQPSGPLSTLHGKRNHPVVQVSVEDAMMFASWIGRRLPTEAEWEAAARTDLGNKYPWGNTFDPDALNIEQSGIADTCEVDKYDRFANEFQICDLLGNVMEWTSDTQTPPIKTDSTTLYSIAKGAAWNAKNTVDISSRALFKPGFTSNTIGFRCTSEIFL